MLSVLHSSPLTKEDTVKLIKFRKTLLYAFMVAISKSYLQVFSNDNMQFLAPYTNFNSEVFKKVVVIIPNIF